MDMKQRKSRGRSPCRHFRRSRRLGSLALSMGRSGIHAMKEVNAEMANMGACQGADKNTALHRRYGEIGISAVAAAARYQGTAKNPAYAPAASTTCRRRRSR